MGGSHTHGQVPEVSTARVPRLLLLGGLLAAAVATVVGLVVLWPDSEPPSVAYSAEGVTYPSAEVVEVNEPCPVIAVDPAAPPTGEQPVFPENCDQLLVEVLEGPTAEEQTLVPVPPGVAASGLEPGDRVRVVAIPADGERPTSYGYVGTDRNAPILAMTVLFVVVVAVVARLRGILALLGLVFAGFVLSTFMLPALLLGSSGLGVAAVGSSAIMFVVLYLAHGPSIRTSTALAGTLLGVAITAVLGLYVIDTARLTGLGEEGELLRAQAPDMNFQGLLTCAIIVAGLGVLNDVTISQSSSVWELRAAAPEMPRSQLFASGMRIGRDHIASTIYTIVFAYAGTALAVLLLLSLYDRPVLDTLADEAIATEVLRTLASAVGLVLAVPITTAIAAATVGPARVADRSPERAMHSD
jgi:uncharacterized membrane protein